MASAVEAPTFKPIFKNSRSVTLQNIIAETLQHAGKQGKVPVGKLTWHCSARRCTAKGSVSAFSISQCRSLASKVGMIASYRYGSKHFTRAQLSRCNPVSAIKKAVQPTASQDGKTKKTLAPVNRQNPKRLHHRDRAVSKKDFQPLAQSSPGVNISRVTRPSSKHTLGQTPIKPKSGLIVPGTVKKPPIQPGILSQGFAATHSRITASQDQSGSPDSTDLQIPHTTTTSALEVIGSPTPPPPPFGEFTPITITTTPLEVIGNSELPPPPFTDTFAPRTITTRPLEVIGTPIR